MCLFQTITERAFAAAAAAVTLTLPFCLSRGIIATEMKRLQKRGQERQKKEIQRETCQQLQGEGEKFEMGFKV